MTLQQSHTQGWKIVVIDCLLTDLPQHSCHGQWRLERGVYDTPPKGHTTFLVAWSEKGMASSNQAVEILGGIAPPQLYRKAFDSW